MKECYIRKLTTRPAIADVWTQEPGKALITRINVPHEHRREGHGTALLEQILRDADHEGVTLFIEVQASDGPSRDALLEWYLKYGFKSSDIFKYFLMREPVTPA